MQTDTEKIILEAVEEEQRRIGQELHDGVCQQLMGAACLAKVLAQKLTARAPAESAEAAEIAELLNQSVDQMRDLARGLTPAEVEAAGLTAALQKFAADIERLYPISCVFIHEGFTDIEFPHVPLMATHLYRIVQEAVNNAIRHGKARNLVIMLTAVQEHAMLTIQDDGIGLPPNADKKTGLGVRSMNYRAKMIGARVKVCRDVGGGTVVACSFHCRDASQSRKTDFRKARNGNNSVLAR